MKRMALALVTSATGAALACGACAAADASATASNSANDQSQVLQTVVVTAEKRQQSELRVAAPVTALTTDQLARQAAAGIASYAADVPGLNMISSEPGQTVVMIRGIGTGFGADIPATVGTYIDDVPYGSSTSSAYGSIGTLDLDPAILQRIEVLSGPQGTLYGASSMGGLIKYVTRAPSLTGFSGQASVDGTTVAHGDQGGGASAVLDGPLLEGKLGATLSAFYRRDPGYIDDPFRHKSDVNASQSDGGRLAALWEPTDRLAVEGQAIIQDTNTPDTSEVDYNIDMTPIYGKYEQVRWGNENWDLHVRLYSLRASYDLGWASLASITSYATRQAKWDIDETNKFGSLVSGVLGIPNLGLFDNVTLDHKKTTQEFRLTSPDNLRLEWLGGLFFTHEHSVKPEAFSQPFSALDLSPVPAAAVPGGLFADTLHDKYTEYAGYGDLTYHFTSSFKILGGVRYTSTSEDSTTPFSGLLNGGSIVVNGHASSHTVTYLAAPSYSIDDDNIFYARYATGFRPGGPTNVTSTAIYGGAPEAYKPDSLDSYELGYKGQFPHQFMTLQVSVFHLDWKDMQLLTEINGFNVTGNAGTARSDGLELAWAWRPVRGLSLSVNGAYTDARMTSDAPQVGAKSGDQLPNSPKFSANATADYDFQLADKTYGFVGGDYQYLGARPIDYVSGVPVGYVRPVMPAYSVVNLRAGVDISELEIELYVKNVGDTYGLTRLRSQERDGVSAPLAAAIIPPRTIGISLTQRF